MVKIHFWAQNLLYISATGARCDERMQDNQSVLPVAGLESNMFSLAGCVLLFFLLVYDCLFVHLGLCRVGSTVLILKTKKRKKEKHTTENGGYLT